MTPFKEGTKFVASLQYVLELTNAINKRKQKMLHPYVIESL